ncbi:MAG: hypothetical protein FWF44_09895 [Defluviitaleaceae bacterium]|nr:hypothetical protein [Defluviitaleaceae bacterium]
MAITAKARATTHLEGTTNLDVQTMMQLLKETSSTVKGGGKSLLTTGLWNIGAHINIVSSNATTIQFTLTSGKDLVELCAFKATMSAKSSGKTFIRVGGLDTYKTTQQKMYGLIPAGPKMIHGMDPYKRFLEAVQQEILTKDSSAQLIIKQDQV